MQIRRAGMAEAAAIAMLVRCYWELEGISGFDQATVTHRLAALLSKPDRGRCWVADTGGGIVGYLLAVFTFSLEHGGLMAEIDEFFVIPAQRSAGGGSLLLKAAERDLSAAGALRLQLQLNVHNQRGREFYLRHGFEPRAEYALYEKPM
jgi:GNAT superfamily N-acetyltransferase